MNYQYICANVKILIKCLLICSKKLVGFYFFLGGGGVAICAETNNLKHKRFSWPATIYAIIDTFYQPNGAKICVINSDANCHRRRNMPSTLKQIVAEIL